MFQLSDSGPDNLPDIAKCQILCFPESFNAKLGKGFVTKSLRWFLASDKRFLFHVVCNREIVGFCGGFAPQFYGDGSSSGMLQFAFRQAVIGTLKKPWLLLNMELKAYYPFILRNIKKKLRLSKTTTKNAAPADFVLTPTVGLVVIGVKPGFRGKGIFEILMNEFENKTMQLGINGCILSVREDNARAIAAYKRMGWIVFEKNKNTLVFQKILDVRK